MFDYKKNFKKLKSHRTVLIVLGLLILIGGGLFFTDVLAYINMSGTSSNTISTGTLNKGLVGHWPLDGEHFNSSTNRVDDISGYGNHGTNSGGTFDVLGRNGKSNGAISLDGSGTIDGTVYGDNVVLDESVTRTDNYSDGVTYSVWINVDTDAVDRMSLFRGHSTIRHIEIYSSSKHFRTEAAKQNGYSFGTGTFPDDVRGTWSHFVIVFANNETNRPVRWYQNGDLFHTGSMDDGTYPGTEYFSFGSVGRSTGNTSYHYAKSFDGKIEDLRIYNRALSESEIKSLYESHKPKMSTTNLNKGLILDMPLKNKSGKTEGTVNLAPSGERTCATSFSRESAHRQTYDYSQLTNVAGRDNVTRLYIDPVTGDNPYADWGFNAYKSGGSDVGDVYAISFDYKMIKGTGLPFINVVYKDGHKDPDPTAAASVGSATRTELEDGWYRYSNTATITLAGTTWWRFGQRSNDIETEFYVDNFQIELKDHITPFVDGTRLDKTSDLTPYSNHGTIYGATVGENYTTFDGDGDYISIPHNNNLSFGVDDFSISLWTYRTATGYQGGSYFSKGSATAGIGTYDGKLRISTITGVLADVGFDATFNTWEHHIFAITQNSTPYIKHYINGILDNTGYEAFGNLGTVSSDGFDFRIGFSHQSPLTRYFNGDISNTKIYNRSLSTYEIQTLFNKERGDFGI